MCMLKKLNKNEKQSTLKKRERTKKEWAKGEEEPHKKLSSVLPVSISFLCMKL